MSCTASSIRNPVGGDSSVARTSTTGRASRSLTSDDVSGIVVSGMIEMSDILFP